MAERDEVAQMIYDDLNKQGIFKNDEVAQMIGHDLRGSGLVMDPTQGGLVTPTPPPSAAPTPAPYLRQPGAPPVLPAVTASTPYTQAPAPKPPPVPRPSPVNVTRPAAVPVQPQPQAQSPVPAKPLNFLDVQPTGKSRIKPLGFIKSPLETTIKGQNAALDQISRQFGPGHHYAEGGPVDVQKRQAAETTAQLGGAELPALWDDWTNRARLLRQNEDTVIKQVKLWQQGKLSDQQAAQLRQDWHDLEMNRQVLMDRAKRLNDYKGMANATARQYAGQPIHTGPYLPQEAPGRQGSGLWDVAAGTVAGTAGSIVSPVLNAINSTGAGRWLTRNIAGLKPGTIDAFTKALPQARNELMAEGKYPSLPANPGRNALEQRGLDQQTVQLRRAFFTDVPGLGLMPSGDVGSEAWRKRIHRMDLTPWQQKLVPIFEQQVAAEREAQVKAKTAEAALTDVGGFALAELGGSVIGKPVAKFLGRFAEPLESRLMASNAPILVKNAAKLGLRTGVQAVSHGAGAAAAGAATGPVLTGVESLQQVAAGGKPLPASAYVQSAVQGAKQVGGIGAVLGAGGALLHPHATINAPAADVYHTAPKVKPDVVNLPGGAKIDLNTATRAELETASNNLPAIHPAARKIREKLWGKSPDVAIEAGMEPGGALAPKEPTPPGAATIHTDAGAVPARSLSVDDINNVLQDYATQETQAPLTPEQAHGKAQAVKQAELHQQYAEDRSVPIRPESGQAYQDAWTSERSGGKTHYDLLNNAADQVRETSPELAGEMDQAKETLRQDFQRDFRQRDLVQNGVLEKPSSYPAPPEQSVWRGLTEEERNVLPEPVKKVLLTQDLTNSLQVLSPDTPVRELMKGVEFRSSKALERIADQRAGEAEQAFGAKHGVSAPEPVSAPAETPVASETVPASNAHQVEATPEAVAPQAQAGEVAPPANQIEPSPAEVPVDRRVNVEQRKSVTEMSPEEMKTALLTDDTTGLGNKRAWEEAPKEKHIASVDADSLKWVNDNYGHPAGDGLLSAVGDALKRAGLGEHFYHVSGDEFYGHGADPDDLAKRIEAANEWLGEHEITFKDKDGVERTVKGLGISYGIGEDLHAAEGRLGEAKVSREAGGQRAGRGERPPRLVESTQGSGETAGRPGAARPAGEGAARERVGGHQEEARPVEKTAAKRTREKTIKQIFLAEVRDLPLTKGYFEGSPDFKDPTQTATVKQTHEALRGARTGESVEITGFRQNSPGGQIPGTGIFYATHPWTAGEYEKGEGSGEFSVGGRVQSLSVEKMKFENPLVIDGRQGRFVWLMDNEGPLYKGVAEGDKNTIRAAYARAKTVGERGYALVDKAIASAVRRLGHDGIIYRKLGQEMDQSEIVDLRGGKASRTTEVDSMSREPARKGGEAGADPTGRPVIQPKGTPGKEMSDFQAFGTNFPAEWDQGARSVERSLTISDVGVGARVKNPKTGVVLELQKEKTGRDYQGIWETKVVDNGVETRLKVGQSLEWHPESPIKRGDLLVQEAHPLKEQQAKPRLPDDVLQQRQELQRQQENEARRQQGLPPREQPLRQMAQQQHGSAMDAAELQRRQEEQKRQMAQARGVTEASPPEGVSPDVIAKLFPDPETRNLFLHDKGDPARVVGFREEARQKWQGLIAAKDQFINGWKRVFPDLARTAAHSELEQLLLRRMDADAIANFKAQNSIRQALHGLNKNEQFAFNALAYNKDMIREIARQRERFVKEGGDEADFKPLLRDGWTEETALATQKAIADTLANDKSIDAQKVADAYQKVIDYRKPIVDKFVKLYEKVNGRKLGIDPEDYFRHNMLLAEAGGYGKGSVAGVHGRPGRSHLKGRLGSDIAYNSDFVEAELSWMPDMVKDTMDLQILSHVQDNYDISEVVKAAKAEVNDPGLLDYLQEHASGLKPTNDMLPAMGKLAAAGHLPDRMDGRFSTLIHSLHHMFETNMELKRLGKPEIGLSPEMEKELPAYAKWLVKEKGENVSARSIADDPNWLKRNGYSEFQAIEGRHFFKVMGVPERLMKDAQGQILQSLDIDPNDLRTVMALGQERRTMVVPEDVARTLDRFAARPEENYHNWLAKGMRTVQQWWKLDKLYNPVHSSIYWIGNALSDADAIMRGNPKAFRYVMGGGKELFNVLVRGKDPGETLKTWIERGGIASSFVAREAVGRGNGVDMLRDFAARQRPFYQVLAGGAQQAFTLPHELREATGRYATYLAYLDDLKKTGQPRNYGASNPALVDGLSDIHDKAWKLSNDLIGPYNEVNATGQFLRRNVFPFWSWQAVSAGREKMLLKNAWDAPAIAERMGKKISGGTAVGVRAIALGRYAAGAASVGLTLEAWNRLNFGANYRDKLPKDMRDRIVPVLCLRYDPQSDTMLYMDRPGNLVDVTNWLNLNKGYGYYQDYMNRKMTLPEIAEDMFATGAKNRLWQQTGFHLKFGTDVVLGYKTFPDVNNPRPARDKAQQFFDTFSLGKVYASIKGYPTPPPTKVSVFGKEIGGRAPWWVPFVGGSDVVHTLTSTNVVNIGESNYFDTIGQARDWAQQQKGGGEVGGGFPNDNKSQAIYYFKLSQRYGDKDSAEKFLWDAARFGETDEGVKGTLKSLDPLQGLSESQRARYMEQLSPDDSERLRRAYQHWAQLIAPSVDAAPLVKLPIKDMVRQLRAQADGALNQEWSSHIASGQTSDPLITKIRQMPEADRQAYLSSQNAAGEQRIRDRYGVLQQRAAPNLNKNTVAAFNKLPLADYVKQMDQAIMQYRQMKMQQDVQEKAHR